MDQQTADALWKEISGIFQFASVQLESLCGKNTCFRLRKLGKHVVCADSVLQRVQVMNQVSVTVEGDRLQGLEQNQSGQIAVLRMRLSDWHFLGQHVDEITAIWTQVSNLNGSVVLDSTVGPAFLTGHVQLAKHEALRMAEIFCGGFCGWTQAAYCLREGGVPVKTSWLLDSDPELIEPIKIAHPEVKVTFGPGDFDVLHDIEDTLFLRADFNDGWWHRVWAGRTPDLLAASPPCQPWSTAGHQGGLQCPDGGLFLSLASVAGMSAVPVICIEEVRGFACHPDSKYVLAAWKDSGYQLVFQEVKNLSEVLPTHRPRLLMIFLHEQTARCNPATFQVASWQPVPRPVLCSSKCYFKAQPDALLNPCLLTDEVKSKYLDVWYLPPSCNHLDPFKFRVHQIHSRAPCFLAQYHYQHQLSDHLLETKGLLGGLLETPKGIRFYSAPEIATCHGVVGQALFPLPDRTTMRILGNSIGVPHAVLALAHCLQGFHDIHRPDPAQLVHTAHKLRIKSNACALLRVQKGWILIGVQNMGPLLARDALRREVELGLIRSRPVFHRVDVQQTQSTEHDTLEVFFSAHLNPQEALEAFGFVWEHTPPKLKLNRPSRVHTVDIQEPPTLRLPTCLDLPNPVSRALAVLTPQGAVSLDRSTPDVFAQLRWVFRWANDHGPHAVQCLNFHGRQVDTLEQMPALLLVIPKEADTLFPMPCPTPTQLQAIRASDTDTGVLFLVHEDYAADWWAQWPLHVLPNLGWQTHFGPFPPALGHEFRITLEPAITMLRLRKPDIKRWLREIFFLGQVDQGLQENPSQSTPVVWQVETRTISRSAVRAENTPADIEAWWYHASTAAGCWPFARVFSGPFALPVDCPLRHIPCSSFYRKNGCIVLTVMPEVRGGGDANCLPKPVPPCVTRNGTPNLLLAQLQHHPRKDALRANQGQAPRFQVGRHESVVPRDWLLQVQCSLSQRKDDVQPCANICQESRGWTQRSTLLCRNEGSGQGTNILGHYHSILLSDEVVNFLPEPVLQAPCTPHKDACKVSARSCAPSLTRVSSGAAPGLLTLTRVGAPGLQSELCPAAAALYLRVSANQVMAESRSPDMHLSPRIRAAKLVPSTAQIILSLAGPPVLDDPLSADNLASQRERLFLGLLTTYISSCRANTWISVMIQVGKVTLGKLRLPGTITPSELETCWKLASKITGTWPTARVYSGPFPLAFSTPLQMQRERFFSKKNVGLVLTVVPETRGGGAKDENHQLAVSKIASSCLERGVPLEKASTAAQDLVRKAGAKACLHAHQSGDAKAIWVSLQTLARTHSVEWPEADNRTERAAKRIQRAVRQKRLRNQDRAFASSFRLDPSVWLGMDEMPVQLLEKIELHATGIYFTDAHESSKEDLALWAGIHSDALCIVFLGHSCPDPETCAGTVTAPATCVATGSKHLLACCFHQVGSTPIRPTFVANAQVDTTTTVVCSFEMQKDDLPENKHWADLVQGPVRAVQAAFATEGISKAITSPWGRSFRAGGKASTPLLCDSFLFRAKVPSSLLPCLLQKSGYNHVYVVPRNVDDRPLSGWRIVWVTATRAETVRQAALLPSQHGLVRSRNKFGVRVPSEHFGAAFKKLRPEDSIPIEIEVKDLFKLGPVPIGATADKIAAWASDLRWPVRVLRSLGPAHWLLGASGPPPTECPCMNGTPVLLTRLPGRSQQAPVVIGHGPLKRLSTPLPMPNPDPAEDPWDVQDPWSQYKGNKGKAESKAASASASPPTRVPDTAQTARLQALERGLATLQAQHQQSLRDREVEKQQVAAEFNNLRGDMKTLHSTLSNQVQTSLDSFRAAQLQQEQQVKAGMDELKMLLLQSSSEKKQRKEPSHE